MAKQMSLIKNIDIDYFTLKSKESLVITRKTRYRGGNSHNQGQGHQVQALLVRK